jgi:hypothetical protein
MTVTCNGLSAPPVEAGDYIVTVIFDEGADYAATTLELGVLTITSTVGNTAIPASGIWTSDGVVHIAAASAGTASVYNTVGHLVATRSYTSGETVIIPLPKGVYFIMSEGKSCKVIVRD